MDITAISVNYPHIDESAKTDAYADVYASMSNPLGDLQLVYQLWENGYTCPGFDEEAESDKLSHDAAMLGLPPGSTLDDVTNHLSGIFADRYRAALDGLMRE